MGSVPIPRTFQAGELETDGYLNSLSAAINFLLTPPVTRVQTSTAAAIPDITWSFPSFTSALWDTDGCFNVSSPTRATIQTPGKYAIVGSVAFQPHIDSGLRAVEIWKNGVEQLPGTYSYPAQSSQDTRLQVAQTLQFVAGDYLQVGVYQQTGAPLNINYCYLDLRWVSK